MLAVGTSPTCRIDLQPMTMRNTSQAWGAPARLLHWAIAALVLVEFPLGLVAAGWKLSPTKLDLFVWHKSLGMLILALMAVRVAWRLGNVAPSPPIGMPPRERLAARLGHLLLYLLLILLPVSGWVVSAAANVPFRIFRAIPVPAIVEPDPVLATRAASVHAALGVLLVLLLVVHVAAALRHHFVDRDDVLARMLPGMGRHR
jgi:cytochrome b561